MNSETRPPDAEPQLTPYEGGPLGAGIDWADPNSAVAPLYFTPAGVLAVAVLGLAFFVFSSAPLRHTDFWSHLKYGEWIAANHTLPEYEPLNPYTDKQARMFDAQWLTQFGYHKLFEASGKVAGSDPRKQIEAGVEAVRIVHAFVAVATLAFLGLAYRRVSGSVGWAPLGMLLVMILILSPLSVQRPQSFGIMFFAAVLCGLSRPVITRRAIVWLPLVMVLWANLHGSFVVGFGLIGVVLLGRMIELFMAEGGSVVAILRDTAVQRLLAALSLGFAAVALLTPHGPTIYLDILRFGGNPNLRTFGEWQPLDFSEARGGHWGYLATLILVAVAQVASPRAFSPTQLLMVVTLGIWPLFQQRAMVWWVPVVPWIVAPHLVAAANAWGWRREPAVPNFRLTMFAGLIAVLAFLISPASAWVKKGTPRPVTVALHRGTPYDIAAVLSGTAPAEPDRVEALTKAIREGYGGRYVGRVFCSETLGEYLLWALPPDAPVTLFNHAHLFTPDYWRQWLSVKEGKPGWWEALDRHNINVVIVEADTHEPLCAELRSNSAWNVVLDEAGASGRDLTSRLFVAIRKPATSAGEMP